ncbi:MAG TPA: hypothetical protein VFR66_12510 [Burkholderiales bacterium]|nr:hypothetical protein [Burkholderiales bacterium]
MPLFARHIARELTARHPGLSAREIGELMRAELGVGATADQLRLGSPLWALLVLLVLKIALDFNAHVKEHSPS